MSDQRYVTCPLCERRIEPGESAVFHDDPDPWRQLAHEACEQIAEDALAMGGE